VTNAASSLPEPGFEQIDDELCRSFQTHLEVIGRRWNSGILLAAVRGATRFSEYRAMVAGISDRLLSQRLRELESEHLIERTVFPTTPVQVHYRPTDRGRDLLRILQPLVGYAYKYEGADAVVTRIRSRSVSS
jgi:DNA-binding HxlR family transcriptional regulator